MKAVVVMTFVALALAPAPAGSAADDTAAGFWQQADQDGHVGAWFYFSLVNGLYQGRLVKLFHEPGEQDSADVCAKCVGKEKNAPLLGLTIVKGMRRDGRNYEDGTILDPRDGKVYHAQMELSADGQKLSVRGYLGVPLLGQTQVWTRLPDDAVAPADMPRDSVSATSQ